MTAPYFAEQTPHFARIVIERTAYLQTQRSHASFLYNRLLTLTLADDEVKYGRKSQFWGSGCFPLLFLVSHRAILNKEPCRHLSSPYRFSRRRPLRPYTPVCLMNPSYVAGRARNLFQHHLMPVAQKRTLHWTSSFHVPSPLQDKRWSTLGVHSDFT